MMKQIFGYVGLAVLLAQCAGPKTMESSEARQQLEDRFTPKVGVATKQDFVQVFGPANWCRPSPTGEETCRFYRKLETKWMGDKTNRYSRETFDEAVAEFDENGVLKSIKGNAQR